VVEVVGVAIRMGSLDIRRTRLDNAELIFTEGKVR